MSDEKVTEYVFGNVTVRIHGEQPDRPVLEAACIDLLKSAIRHKNSDS